MLKVLKQY